MSITQSSAGSEQLPLSPNMVLTAAREVEAHLHSLNKPYSAGVVHDCILTIENMLSRTSAGIESAEVQDTYLVGGPDLKAMSGSVESDRVIQLHFRRKATDADRKWLLEAINAKIAAGKAGVGDVAQPSAGTSEPVAYRWRQPGNKHWIYDPTPEWIEDHKHEIELEPLFNGVAQPSPAQLVLAEMFSHSAINEAMQDAWNDICSDTGCHPLDIEQGRSKQLTFSPNHWANQIAKRLFLRAVKVQLKADAEASALPSTDLGCGDPNCRDPNCTYGKGPNRDPLSSPDCAGGK